MSTDTRFIGQVDGEVLIYLPVNVDAKTTNIKIYNADETVLYNTFDVFITDEGELTDYIVIEPA